MATIPHNPGDSPGMYYKCGQFISMSRDTQDESLSAKYMNFIRDPRAVEFSSWREECLAPEMRDFLKPGYSREEAIMVEYLEGIEGRTKKLPRSTKGAGRLTELSKGIGKVALAKPRSFQQNLSIGKQKNSSKARVINQQFLC